VIKLLAIEKVKEEEPKKKKAKKAPTRVFHWQCAETEAAICTVSVVCQRRPRKKYTRNRRFEGEQFSNPV